MFERVKYLIQRLPRAIRVIRWSLSSVLVLLASIAARAQDDVKRFHFVENVGQWDRSVLYQGRASDALLTFGSDWIEYRFPLSSPSGYSFGSLRTSFLNTRSLSAVTGESRTRAVWNYILGQSHEEQFEAVRSFRRIRYRELYAGIDAVVREKEGATSYDFLVKPGAEPDRIAVEYEGADSIRVSKSGQLEIFTGFGIVREDAPVSWQTIGNRRVPVNVEFRTTGKRSFRFQVGSYDVRYPLTIDPCLSIEYLTYFGGGGYDEVTSMAVDSSGFAYAAGLSRATNFPTIPDATQDQPQNMAFISKISPDGTQLLYSTLFGPEYVGPYDILLDDGVVVTRLYEALGESVEVGQDGRAVLAFTTNQPNLPTSSSAYQPGRAPNRIDSRCGPPFGDNFDTYVARLAVDGSLEWSTYLGGEDHDYVRDVTLTADDRVAITGVTHAARCGGTGDSLVYPTTIPRDSFSVSDPIRGFETFVSVLSADGRSLYFSALYGGSQDEFATRIVAMESGELYLLGSTNSSDLRTTAGAYQDTAANGLSGSVYDLYLARIDPANSTLEYSTYISDGESTLRRGLGFGGYVDRMRRGLPLGGLTTERGYNGLVIESDGRLLIGGTSRTTSLPGSGGGLQSSPQNASGDDSTGVDAFIMRFNVNDNRVDRSTYLGGSGFDGLGGLGVDGDGNVVAGVATSSSDYPITRFNVQSALDGTADGAVTVLSPGLNGLEFSSYVGGGKLSGALLWEQSVRGVAVGSDGSYFVYGGTVSWDLPYTPDAFLRSNDFHGGWIAKFVASETPRIGAPLSIDFPTEACDQIRIVTELLYNSGQQPLTIDSIGFQTGRYFSLSGSSSFPLDLAACDSLNVDLAFNPTSPGPDTLQYGSSAFDTLLVFSSNAAVSVARVPVRASRQFVGIRLQSTEINDPRYKLGSPRGYNIITFVSGEVTQKVTIEPDPNNDGLVSLRSPWQERPVRNGVQSIDFDVNATDTGYFCERFYLRAMPCDRRDTIDVCVYVRSGFFNVSPDSLKLGVVGCHQHAIPTKVWNTGNDTLEFRVLFVGGDEASDIEYDFRFDSVRQVAPGDTFEFTTWYRPKGTGDRVAFPVYQTDVLQNEFPGQKISATLDTVRFELELADAVGAYNEIVEVPIDFVPVRSGRVPFEGLTFLLKYDPNLLAIEGLNRTGYLAEGWDVVESRLTADGRFIRIRRGEGGQPIDTEGRIAAARFRVLRGDSIASPIDIELAGVSANCLDATVPGLYRFDLSDECLAHNRLVFSGNRMLKRPYPNPATESVTIPFRVPTDGSVTVRLFDVNGELVRTVVEDEMEEGEYLTEIPTRVLPGGGLYFCRMIVNGVLTDVREVLVQE